MNTINKEYFALRKEQGLKAGIVPVPTPSDEENRLKELERLGILEKDFESDRRFNNITQIARYLTDCQSAASARNTERCQHLPIHFGRTRGAADH